MRKLTEKLGFPREAVEFFSGLWENMTGEDRKLFDFLRLQWFTEEQDELENARVCEALSRWGEEKGISPYSAHMLFLLHCAPLLEERYDRAGLEKTLYWDLMGDLTVKLRECRQTDGVWGTVSFQWFQRYYTLSLFQLGRLQFEPRAFAAEHFSLGSVCLKAGDPVYGVHIPSGVGFTAEARLDSLRRAYQFFKIPAGGVLTVDCWSWLLWPENGQFYPEGSNLMDFFRSFAIVQKKDPDIAFPDGWRVFGQNDISDLDALPADTRLRQAILAHLRQGGKIGWGYGVLLFDGERILTKQG